MLHYDNFLYWKREIWQSRAHNKEEQWPAFVTRFIYLLQCQTTITNKNRIIGIIAILLLLLLLKILICKTLSYMFNRCSKEHIKSLSGITMIIFPLWHSQIYIKSFPSNGLSHPGRRTCDQLEIGQLGRPEERGTFESWLGLLATLSSRRR